MFPIEVEVIQDEAASRLEHRQALEDPVQFAPEEARRQSLEYREAPSDSGLPQELRKPAQAAAKETRRVNAFEAARG